VNNPLSRNEIVNRLRDLALEVEQNQASTYSLFVPALQRLEATIEKKRLKEKSNFQKIVADHLSVNTPFATEKMCTRDGKGRLLYDLDLYDPAFLQPLLTQVLLPAINWFVSEAISKQKLIPSLSMFFDDKSEGWFTLNLNWAEEWEADLKTYQANAATSANRLAGFYFLSTLTLEKSHNKLQSLLVETHYELRKGKVHNFVQPEANHVEERKVQKQPEVVVPEVIKNVQHEVVEVEIEVPQPPYVELDAEIVGPNPPKVSWPKDFEPTYKLKWLPADPDYIVIEGIGRVTREQVYYAGFDRRQFLFTLSDGRVVPCMYIPEAWNNVSD
jgi:hypothetical protein